MVINSVIDMPSFSAEYHSVGLWQSFQFAQSASLFHSVVLKSKHRYTGQRILVHLSIKITKIFHLNQEMLATVQSMVAMNLKVHILLILCGMEHTNGSF